MTARNYEECNPPNCGRSQTAPTLGNRIHSQFHKPRLQLLLAKSVAKEAELRFLVWADRDRKDIEAIHAMMPESRHVRSGGADDTLLFSESDGVFRGRITSPGFHFDKNQLIAVPCNQIHFTAADAVS